MTAFGFTLPSGNRLLALAVLAVLVLAPALWIVSTQRAASVLAATLDQQSAMLAEIQVRLAAKRAGAGALASASEAANVFLPGETGAIAGAALQRRVSDTIAAAGGRLIESEFAAPADPAEGDPGRVDLRVTFDAEIVSFQAILLDLEAGTPILLVRSLDVQSATEPAANSSPPLRVGMLVGGYWKAAP